MTTKRAVAGGVVGAAIITLLSGLGIWMQWTPLSLEMLLGSFITGKTTAGTWVLGFAWHLLNGAIFGLAYAALFNLFNRSGPGVGALIGLMHWAVAGVLLGFVQALHPLTLGTWAEYEFRFFSWAALGAMTFFGSLVLHLVFGIIVGAAATTPNGRIQDRTTSRAA